MTRFALKVRSLCYQRLFIVKYNLISGGFYSTLERYTDIKRDMMTGFALTQIVTVIFIFISSFLMFHSGDQVKEFYCLFCTCTMSRGTSSLKQRQ